MTILSSPQSKTTWKKICKAKVLSWWETKLRDESIALTSLTFFKPSFMSLNRIHPIWSTAETPFEVTKAAVLADMISGRYITDYRARHWSKKNSDGYCQLCDIKLGLKIHGTLEHLLLFCPVLSDTRAGLLSLWAEYSSDKPEIAALIMQHSTLDNDVNLPSMELLMDPSSCPEVIRIRQVVGEGILIHTFYLARTWCYSHHLKSKKLKKLYNLI